MINNKFLLLFQNLQILKKFLKKQNFTLLESSINYTAMPVDYKERRIFLKIVFPTNV